MKNQPVAVTQPITFCAFAAVCLWGCDMKVKIDEKKDKAIELANKLIATNKLNIIIASHGWQLFEDIVSQIDFWNQHISKCLLDDNKNISLNDDFKSKAKFYSSLLEEIGNKLKYQSYLTQEEIKTILKK
ncbi:hypothetical protein PTN23_001289 [Salmonella enterica]|nr:hypothetical protein [Salmonella enterica]EMD3912035.1 hypothetical protein [Salmonella enterica]EMD4995345.1 hypothetical protein [Salmonella enterica]